MFHKILVALDSSAIGKQVFEEAVTLAKATGASLTLLHVLSAEEASPKMFPLYRIDLHSGMNETLWEIYQEQWEMFEKQGLELLRSRTESATAIGLSAEFIQIPGRPGQTICQLARTWEADLIVIGRRGRSGLSELVLGSVSNYVLHHASCSVLTVQSPVDDDLEVAQAEQVASD